ARSPFPSSREPPALTAWDPPAWAVCTAMPLTSWLILTPTMTLLNPRHIALGTTGMSLHEAAHKGARQKARGPPLTWTLGLPTALEPWAPGNGSGGIRSLAQVCHFVYDCTFPLIAFQ